MTNKYKFIVALAIVSLCACGKDDAATTTTTSTTAAAVTTANSKLKAVSDMIGGSSAFAPMQEQFMPREFSERATLGINGVWTTVGGVSALSGTGTTTLKTWFIQEFDETFENDSSNSKVTFAGRVSNALGVFCYMANSSLTMESSTNLPAVGTHGFTMTAAMNNSCGGGATDAVGTSMTLTVTATTDTTYYDRNLSFTFPGEEACPFKMKARISSTAINLIQSEDQTCQTRDHASKSVFTYDVASRVARFMYFSKSFSAQSGYEVYQGYLNETTDEAYVVGFYGGDDNGDTTFPNGLSFTASGKPVAGGTVAISVMSINNTIADNVYRGCINASTVDVDADDTLACTLTGADATTTHSTVVQDLYDDYATLNSVYDTLETDTVNFTNSTDVFQ